MWGFYFLEKLKKVTALLLDQTDVRKMYFPHIILMWGKCTFLTLFWCEENVFSSHFFDVRKMCHTECGGGACLDRLPILVKFGVYFDQNKVTCCSSKTVTLFSMAKQKNSLWGQSETASRYTFSYIHTVKNLL